MNYVLPTVVACASASRLSAHTGIFATPSVNFCRTSPNANIRSTNLVEEVLILMVPSPNLAAKAFYAYELVYITLRKTIALEMFSDTWSLAGFSFGSCYTTSSRITLVKFRTWVSSTQDSLGCLHPCFYLPSTIDVMLSLNLLIRYALKINAVKDFNLNRPSCRGYKKADYMAVGTVQPRGKSAIESFFCFSFNRSFSLFCYYGCTLRTCGYYWMCYALARSNQQLR